MWSHTVMIYFAFQVTKTGVERTLNCLACDSDTKTCTYHMKSLQWLQNVGCLKNRAKNLWFFTSCTFFCLKAPRRCTPFPVDSAILQRSDGLEIDACERSTCRAQKSAVVKTDGCRVCERTGVRVQSDAALYKKSEKLCLVSGCITKSKNKQRSGVKEKSDMNWPRHPTRSLRL